MAGQCSARGFVEDRRAEELKNTTERRTARCAVIHHSLLIAHRCLFNRHLLSSGNPLAGV